VDTSAEHGSPLSGATKIWHMSREKFKYDNDGKSRVEKNCFKVSKLKCSEAAAIGSRRLVARYKNMTLFTKPEVIICYNVARVGPKHGHSQCAHEMQEVRTCGF